MSNNEPETTLVGKDLLFRPVPSFSVKHEWVVSPDDADYGYAELVVTHDGIEIARRAEGSEPEDNCFSRDYAWIKPLLKKVYALGLEDGKNEQNAY